MRVGALTSALLKIIEICVVHLRSTTASAKEMLEVVAGASEESPTTSLSIHFLGP